MYELLEYDRIDVSEGIDINKTNAWKECNICHYWYFLNEGFKYDQYLCNGCHYLIQKPMSFNDVVIAFVKGSDFWIHFWCMSKDDVISIMKTSDLNEKGGLQWIFSLI